MLAAWVMVLPISWAQSPSQHLEVTGRHRIRIIYDYAAVWPPSGSASATFYLPVPPTLDNQQIEYFHSNLGGTATTDNDTPPRHVLHGVIHHQPGNERRLEWRVEVVGTFETHRLVDGPPSASHAIVAPAAGAYLGTSESVDWKSTAFQSWLDAAKLRRTADETPLAYGRRLYDYLAANGRYSYPPQGGWTASGAARRLRTDCGGLSLVFTAACRANQIPARLMVGQWFKTRERSGGSLVQTGKQAHVIAEFFDSQVGWIPEDVSSTLLRVPGHDDYDYFGREPGYFFAWHVDTDFHFAVPGKENGHVQWMQNPAPWFSPSGASGSSSHHWSFEPLN